MSNSEDMIYDKTAVNMLNDKIARLEAECAALKLKDLHKVANDVCRDLPENFEIRIALEHHAGWVELCGPDGEMVELPDPTERTMDQQVYDALFTAMQAGEKL